MKKYSAKLRGRHEALGFTLVELLVVVAILAILMAILMPVLKNTRQVANLATCKANVRELLKAVQMYSANRGNHLVPTDRDHLSFIKQGSGRWGWAGHLAAADMLPDARLLGCPGTRGVTEDDQNRFDVNFDRVFRGSDAWMADSWTTDVWGNYALRTVPATSDFYLKSHSFMTYASPGRLLLAEAVSAFDFPPHRNRVAIHGNRFDSEMNLGFSDGSVVSVEDYADQTKWPWNRRNGYYYPHNDRYSWAFWDVFRDAH